MGEKWRCINAKRLSANRRCPFEQRLIYDEETSVRSRLIFSLKNNAFKEMNRTLTEAESGVQPKSVTLNTKHLSPTVPFISSLKARRRTELSETQSVERASWPLVKCGYTTENIIPIPFLSNDKEKEKL